MRARILDAFTENSYTGMETVDVCLPAPRSATKKPPVVLISVDSLRYDAREQMAPLLDAVGTDGHVPSEPRTQGHWTPPSHASMFTGVHPADHGYVGWGQHVGNRIHTDLTTIVELLTEESYKCSGLVSHTRLAPEFGFGHGFHRYRVDHMFDWIKRDNDARDNINRLIEWIDTDTRNQTGGLFYFLHLFDPHHPYVPPLPNPVVTDLDLEAIGEFKKRVKSTNRRALYASDETDPVSLPDGLKETLRSYYDESVRFTTTQLARLIEHLKARGLYDNALVIITGDHGEDFGEHGVYFHNSLFDANIRPFMLVKPPRDVEWTVRDEVDTLDFFPTIARTAGFDPPPYCQGTALQDARDETEPRITERVQRDWYDLAVEKDGIKGIFTYPENYPRRPDDVQIDNGPVSATFYRRDTIGDDRTFERTTLIEPAMRTDLQTIAERFMRSSSITDRPHEATVSQPAQETTEQMEYLGYRS